MTGVDSPTHVEREHSSCHCCKSSRHNGHQFRLCHRWNVRPNHKRSFCLTDKDIGCRRQTFGTRNFKSRLQDPSQSLHDQLHNAKVIQHGHQGRKEDNRWQHFEGNIELTKVVSKNKLAALIHKVQQLCERVA